MSTIRDIAGRSGPAAAEGHALRAVPELPLLRLERLAKTYRDPMTLKPFTAVRDVTLDLERGEIFGLLGPNGAGKTTTIKMILGLARPTGSSPDIGSSRMRSVGSLMRACARPTRCVIPLENFRSGFRAWAASPRRARSSCARLRRTCGAMPKRAPERSRYSSGVR